MDRDRFKTQINRETSEGRVIPRRIFNAPVPPRTVVPEQVNQPRPTKPEAVAATVSINISVPQFKGLKAAKKLVGRVLQDAHMLTLRILASTRQLTELILEKVRTIRKMTYKLLIIVGISAVVMVGMVVGSQLLKQTSTPQALGSGSAAISGLQATPVKLTFTPVVPRNKPDLATPQAGKSAYDSKKNVFSYTDTLKGTGLVVSEQPLPKQFKSGDEAVVSITKNLNANEAIKTATGKGSIATDAKSQAQTVVYTSDNLLIFVQSPFVHPLSEWQLYLASLKPPQS